MMKIGNETGGNLTPVKTAVLHETQLDNDAEETNHDRRDDALDDGLEDLRAFAAAVVKHDVEDGDRQDNDCRGSRSTLDRPEDSCLVFPPEELRKQIVEIASAIPGVEKVHLVVTEYVGPHLLVDMHINVNGEMTLNDAHEISDQVIENLVALAEIDRAYVHLEPEGWH